MAAPVWESAGTGVGQDNALGDLVVPHPASVAAGDLLLAQAMIRGDNGTVSTPAGWTLLYGPDGTPATDGLAQYIYGRLADGSETSSQTFVTSGDGTSGGRIYRFTGWLGDATLANNFEGGSVSGPTTSTTIADAGVTTTDVDRLCVNFIAVADNNAIAAFAGETGGDWTEAVAEFTSVGDNLAISLQIATLAAAGTIDGGTITMASDPWVVRGFAILPVGGDAEAALTGTDVFSACTVGTLTPSGGDVPPTPGPPVILTTFIR